MLLRSKNHKKGVFREIGFSPFTTTIFRIVMPKRRGNIHRSRKSEVHRLIIQVQCDHLASFEI